MFDHFAICFFADDINLFISGEQSNRNGPFFKQRDTWNFTVAQGY